jgi:hypothetical protein
MPSQYTVYICWSIHCIKKDATPSCEIWSSSDIDKSQRRQDIPVFFQMVYLVVYWPCLFSHFHGLPNAAIHLSQCLINNLWAKGKIFVDLFAVNPALRGYIEICRPSMGTITWLLLGQVQKQSMHILLDAQHLGCF